MKHQVLVWWRDMDAKRLTMCDKMMCGEDVPHHLQFHDETWTIFHSLYTLILFPHRLFWALLPLYLLVLIPFLCFSCASFNYFIPGITFWWKILPAPKLIVCPFTLVSKNRYQWPKFRRGVAFSQKYFYYFNSIELKLEMQDFNSSTELVFTPQQCCSPSLYYLLIPRLDDAHINPPGETTAQSDYISYQGNYISVCLHLLPGAATAQSKVFTLDTGYTGGDHIPSKLFTHSCFI